MAELFWTQVRGHVEVTTPDADDQDDIPEVVRTAIAALDETVFTTLVADDREHAVCTFQTVLRGDVRTVVEVARAKNLDPATRESIRALVKEQAAVVRDAPTRLTVISYEKKWRRHHNRGFKRGAGHAGWELDWQLGREAIHSGRAPDGGFSMVMPGGGVYRDGKLLVSNYRGRVGASGNAGGQTFLNWKVPRDEHTRPVCGHAGPFIELRDLLSTVCGGDVESAEQAAQILGVPWPEATGNEIADAWARHTAEVELFIAARRELRKLCPDLPVHRAFSTGSIVAAMRRAAGIPAASRALRRAAKRNKGAAAASFFGPRCECHLRGVVCPTGLVDIVSTYPACWSAAGLTSLLIADQIEFKDALNEFLEFLASSGLRDQLYDRATARRWGATFVLVSRSRGAQLPAVVEWTPTRVGATVAARWFDDPRGVVMPWPDVARAATHGDQLEILEVIRPVAVGVAPGLRDLRLPDGTEHDLTQEDLGEIWMAMREQARPANGRWTPPRRRRVSVAKLGGNADTFGLGARHDLRAFVHAVLAEAIGPHGEALARRTRHPEVPAPDTSLLLAGAVTSMCRLAIGLLIDDVHRFGGSIMHVATDSVAIPASSTGGLWPCPGGRWRMEDGREAVLLLSFDLVRELTARLDPLLGFRGGAAFKEEAGSLTRETLGIAFGINKLVLARYDGHGRLVIVKSSDTNLGGHLCDPEGSGRRTADGLWQWSSDLELPLFEAALDTDPSLPIPVPEGLPAYAEGLTLHHGQAGTFAELSALRRATGDARVGAFAKFLRAETGATGASPISIGADRGPDTSVGRDWRLRGDVVCLGTRGSDGTWTYVAGDPGAAKRITVRSVADHLVRWLCEVDPSMTGPKRGLRRPTPVPSHPALTRVVGRTREQLDDGSPTYPTLAYGAVERWEPYRLLAWEVGAAEIVRRGGPALRTTSDALLPFANPDDRTRSRIIAALAEPSSHWCVGCGKQIRGRIDRKWCTEACRKKTTRTASRDATRRKGRGRPRALRDREVSPRGVVQMTRRNRSKEQ